MKTFYLMPYAGRVMFAAFACHRGCGDYSRFLLIMTYKENCYTSGAKRDRTALVDAVYRHTLRV